MASVWTVKTGPGTLGRNRRHRRIRKRVHGSAARPRLCVFRSLRHIYAQIVDDDAGQTLAQANSREASLLPEGSSRRSAEAARAVGKAIGERARAAGISKVVFDRGGYLYHGRAQALADSAREAGLDF